ncbi:hypothetical protein Hrd1104_09090 [Halorhabdus sp. CBA1104]|uniref:hypothetical protein n=1 Tax=Halorhabdus sp. CBA1104 TaxID=1380432 RepID=UPI0012B3D595|nr:hypothetical protein [Halorhabdus sp. CBA1104]QGN07449.1 hypothetical protein Hrd1104_09090 [Halorhabdus sp. CBA1104]
MNRRNVLTAMGGLAIGGGALFGSGAFTSVEATRAVEVNIFGSGDDGPTGVVENPDASEETDIAETITNNGVDVLVDPSSDSISLRAPDDTEYTDGTSLFPTEDDTYTSVDSSYVSLVANDVTIVFGANGGLPPNSTLGYSEFFAFVPNSTSTSFDVTFSGPGELLTKVGNGDVSSGSSVAVNAAGTKDATVKTGTTDADTEDLNISIEES